MPIKSRSAARPARRAAKKKAQRKTATRAKPAAGPLRAKSPKVREEQEPAAAALPAEPTDEDEELAASPAQDEEEDEEAALKKGKATDRKEVKDLFAMGRDKGFLTYDEVNDALPADIVSSDQIDDVMAMFGDNDIAIVDEANKVKLPETKPSEPEPVAAKVAEEETAEREEEEDSFSKSNDPVRTYLRKMGSVSLLTREGEVEISKRIEDGEKKVLEAV